MNFDYIDTDFLRVMNKHWDKLNLDEIISINQATKNEIEELGSKTI